MSRDPVRLLDDPGVAEHLKDALRELGEAPAQAFDLDAALARFRNTLAAPPPPAPRIPKHVGWGLGGAAAAGIVIVAVIALRGPRDVQHVQVAVTSATPSPTPNPSPSPVELDLDEAPDSASPAPRGGRDARPAPQSQDDLIRREVQHLAALKGMLASNPAEALRMAEAGHKEFARGMLYQEREAAAIRALVRLGRGAEARARASQFVKRFPRSPYAEQLSRETGL